MQSPCITDQVYFTAAEVWTVALLCPMPPAEAAEGKPHDSQFRVVLSDSLSISGTASLDTNVFCSNDTTAQTAGSYTEPVSIEETSHSWTHRAVYHTTSLHFAFPHQLYRNITLAADMEAHSYIYMRLAKTAAVHACTHGVHLAQAISKEYFLRSLHTFQ